MYNAGIPVVPPLELNHNTLHKYQGCLFALFPSIGGRPYEMDNKEQMESVGMLIGRIHQVGATQTFSYRPTIGLKEYLYRPQDILLSSTYIPQNIQLDLKIILAKLIKTVKQYWYTDWQPIRLHADCHADNILWLDSAYICGF